jgi:hypothetical protein
MEILGYSTPVTTKLFHQDAITALDHLPLLDHTTAILPGEESFLVDLNNLML